MILGLVGLQALAFWPVWPWLLARSFDPSDEGQGWLALLALALLVFRAEPDPERPLDLRPATVLTALYALLFPFAPPLIRALLATLAMVSALLALRTPKLPRIPLLVLAALALPVLPSLQFVLGYPLRIASGTLAAVALRTAGFQVIRQGTMLVHRDALVMIDAPCSGAAMLWASLFLAAVLAARGALDERRSTFLIGLGGLASVLANGVRTTLAFVCEQPWARFPPWTHDALGVAVFAALAAGLAAAQHLLARDLA